MRATLTFSLPDEQAEFDAARLGREALSVVQQIDQWCRATLKHGSPGNETRRLAEEIRGMIDAELLDT
jgi:hypothetical protein